MLRLDNAPQAKVRADCFIVSCFSYRVTVMYHFNRGSVRFSSDVSFSNILILYIVLAVIWLYESQ